MAPKIYSSTLLRGASLAALLGLTLLGCGGSDFPERYAIEGLRIAAVQADPPWLGAGEQTTLRPLVLGIDPSGPAPIYHYSWCPLRGTSSVAFECLLTIPYLNSLFAKENVPLELPDDFYEIGTSSSAEAIFPPRGISISQLYENLCSQLQKEEDLELPSTVALPDCSAPTVTVNVELELTQGERTIYAYKDVTFILDPALAGTRNTNPDLSALELKVVQTGTTSATFDTEVDLEVTPDDPQSFFNLSQIVTETSTITGLTLSSRCEQVIFTWLVTAGELNFYRTGFLPDTIDDPANPCPAPTTPPASPSTFAEAYQTLRENEWLSPYAEDIEGSGPVELYIVARDDRGGQSWIKRDIYLEGNP